MTRWHEDDLVARLLAQDCEGELGTKEGWAVLELPALAESDGADPLGRTEGEALCPGLGFDKAWAKRTRASVGRYWWAALYQQRPAPLEGHLFKRADFRYWRSSHDNDEDLYLLEREGGPYPVSASACTHFQTVDVAATQKQSSDYTVVSTWAATPDRDLLLVDRERKRFEALDVGGFIRRCYEKHQPSFVGVESQGYGLSIVQELGRQGLPIRPLYPDKDKVSRALMAVARYENHRVYHPRSARWLDEWEGELLAFPNARHDDQVDTVSYAARELANLPTEYRQQRSRGKTIMGNVLTEEF